MRGDWTPRTKAGRVLLLGGAALVSVAMLAVLTTKGGGPADLLVELGVPLAPVEPLASHVPQGVCDPTDKPGVVLFRDYVLARWGGESRSLSRACSGAQSEHWEGRAWDWKVRDDKTGAWLVPRSTVDEVLRWLHGSNNRNARRLGIMYWLWEYQAWRSFPSSEGPAGQIHIIKTSKPHLDHVHFSFSWPGARGETSGQMALAASQGIHA